MQKRQLKEGIYWLGAVDWDRRLFDALIPLTDGTTLDRRAVMSLSTVIVAINAKMLKL